MSAIESFDQYIAFVMLYMTHIDGDIDESELLKIKAGMSEQEFNSLGEYYNSLSDTAAIDQIKSGGERWIKSPTEMQMLKSKLQTLMSADHVVNERERMALHIIENLLK